VMKSGKVVLGYKSTLKSLRSGKAKLVIIVYMLLLCDK
jgi:large subunit ribosomal protein L30e